MLRSSSNADFQHSCFFLLCFLYLIFNFKPLKNLLPLPARYFVVPLKSFINVNVTGGCFFFFNFMLTLFLLRKSHNSDLLYMPFSLKLFCSQTLFVSVILFFICLSFFVCYPSFYCLSSSQCSNYLDFPQPFCKPLAKAISNIFELAKVFLDGPCNGIILY